MRAGDSIDDFVIASIHEEKLVLRPSEFAAQPLRHDVLEVWILRSGDAGDSRIEVVLTTDTSSARRIESPLRGDVQQEPLAAAKNGPASRRRP